MFKRELELSTPKLSDQTLIPLLYDWFNEIHNNNHNQLNENNAVQLRKQFVFIILSLYSPQKLVGGKMLNGLRTKLCNVIGLSAKTIISNDSSSLSFEYQTYKDFQKSVDYAYAQILEKLNKMELLTTAPLSAKTERKTISD